MMKYIFSLLACLFLLGCSQSQPVPEPTEVAQPKASKFDSLDLEVGMKRTRVEEQVSTLLGKPMTYGAYGNNLRGGTVEYRSGEWVLQVEYRPGSPAPTIRRPDGTRHTYEPIDETVLAYKTYRIAKELKATGKPAP